MFNSCSSSAGGPHTMPLTVSFTEVSQLINPFIGNLLPSGQQKGEPAAGRFSRCTKTAIPLPGSLGCALRPFA